MTSICQDLIGSIHKISHDADANSGTHIQYFNPKKYVTVDNYESFWVDYCNLLSNKEKGRIFGIFNIGEKVSKNVPIIVDCTVKFRKTDTPHSENANWNDNFILELVYAYQRAMSETLLIESDSDQEYIAVIMETDQVNYDQEDNRIYHYKIQFPFCKVEQSIQKRVIRPRAIYYLQKRNSMAVFSETPIEDWEKMISSSSVDSYVPLYGSVSDPKMPVLIATNVHPRLSIINDDISDDILELNQIFDPTEYALMSDEHIDTEGPLFERYAEDREDINYYLPLLLSVHFYKGTIRLKPEININDMRPTRTRAANETPNFSTLNVYDESDLDIAEQLLPLLSKDRIINDHYWLDVGKSLYNSDKTQSKERAFRLWVQFTENSDEKDHEYCEEHWESFAIENALDVKTIGWYARKDSKDAYNAWHKKKYMPFLERSLSITHDDIAQAFYWIYWLDFNCGSVKNKTWYTFNNHIMREADSGREIRTKLGMEFKNYYEMYQSKISNDITNTTEEHMKAKYQMELKKIGDLIKKLKTVPFKANIMTALLDLFKDDKFEKFANTNVNLMGLDGGVLECCSKYAIVREGKPQDYITMSTTARFNSKLGWESPGVRKVMKWMEQLFPDQLVRTYVLRIFAACLRSKNILKILLVLSGTGNNGKSMLKKLIELAFGAYSHTLPVHVFTTKPKGGPAPEVVDGRFAKIAWFTEPPEDAHLQADSLKSHTGMDRQRARKLYSDGGEFEIYYTLFMLCNKIPIIQGADKAIMLRLKIINMIAIWDYEAPESEEEQKKTNHYKPDINFEAQIPYMVTPFLWILNQYYNDFANHGVQEPPSVKKATEKYFTENDLYKKFLDENVEDAVVVGSVNEDNVKGIRDLNTKLSETDLYQIFKGWARSNFGSMKVPDAPTFKYHMLVRIGKPVKKEYLGFKLKQELKQAMQDKVAKI
jgi:phage/plasmid-associated DNA primase